MSSGGAVRDDREREGVSDRLEREKKGEGLSDERKTKGGWGRSGGR